MQDRFKLWNRATRIIKSDSVCLSVYCELPLCVISLTKENAKNDRQRVRETDRQRVIDRQTDAVSRLLELCRLPNP